METLLVLSGPGVQPWSARGLTQTLDPIGASANTRRTINGALKDLSAPQMRKYQSTISCADQSAPALDGVWPGQELRVECVAELAYKTAGGSPARPVVGEGDDSESDDTESTRRVDGAYTFYRPVLTMRVMSYTQQTDEWGAAVSWSLQLEEV